MSGPSGSRHSSIRQHKVARHFRIVSNLSDQKEQAAHIPSSDLEPKRDYPPRVRLVRGIGWAISRPESMQVHRRHVAGRGCAEDDEEVVADDHPCVVDLVLRVGDAGSQERPVGVYEDGIVDEGGECL